MLVYEAFRFFTSKKHRQKQYSSDFFVIQTTLANYLMLQTCYSNTRFKKLTNI